MKESFDKIGNELEEIMESVNEELVEEAMNEIAPNDRQEDEEANAATNFSTDFPHLLMPEQFQEHDAFAFTENSGSSNTQTLIPHRLSDQDYYRLMDSLNSQQQLFVQHVTFLVKTNKLPFHIFLSGGAGVGKSHTIKAIYQTLSKFHDSTPGNNPDHQKIFIAAPTGRAAYNVQGNTIHSLFGIRPNRSLKQYQKLSYSQLNTLRTNLSEMSILIIDEVSMVGSNMLHYLDQRLQEVFDTSETFGNISVLFVGDLFQLRPVADKWIFQIPSTPYGPLAPSFWIDHIQMFELTRIMRQKNVEYAQMLNRIREAKQTKDDIKQLEGRMVNDIYIHPTYPHLFTQNQLVDEYNQTILGSITTPTIISTAKDNVQGQVTKSQRAALLAEVKEYPTQLAQNLVYSLMLKVSAQYMIIHNVDTSDGLTNGVPCLLKSFECHPSGEPYLVWVQFEDKQIGEHLRDKMRHLYITGINRAWIPIMKITKQFDIRRCQNISVCREQFPLKPCFGMTIHKAQGATLPTVVISFKQCFAPHTVYVAVSRSTDINGVSILHFKESQIKVDQDVVEEMKRLRQNPLPLLPLLPPDDDSSFLVLLNNSRSLHNHIESLKASNIIKKADLLVIQETFLRHDDQNSDYKIDNLSICHRIDNSSTTKRHGGSAIFKQDHVNYHQLLSYIKNGIELILGQTSSFSILSVYKSPSVHVKCLIDELQNLVNTNVPYVFEQLLLIGDLNIDSLQPSRDLDLLQNFLQNTFNMKLVINEETTNYHSCLDHIYLNFNYITSGVQESYWSDHKLVYASFQK